MNNKYTMITIKSIFSHNARMFENENILRCVFFFPLVVYIHTSFQLKDILCLTFACLFGFPKYRDVKTCLFCIFSLHMGVCYRQIFFVIFFFHINFGIRYICFASLSTKTNILFRFSNILIERRKQEGSFSLLHLLFSREI